MTAIVRCARALVGSQERSDFALAIEGERFADAGPFDDVRGRFPDAPVREYGTRVLVAPGFVNGHSHAYQILLRGWADDLTFERWRSEALYKIVPQLTPEQVYWTFRLAFDEMLAGGITTVAEFFYLNGAGNDSAREAIRAAHDAGIRLVFARTWMDADYAPPAFRESIDRAASRTRELMDEFPGVQICVAPHSLHAASGEMIAAAAKFAAGARCMMHVHVAEAQYEAEQTLVRFGLTPVALLHELEALNERTIAVHAIYVSDAEKDLVAQTGARVVHNPTTNQYLGDGICDVTGLQARGVRMALGTDADVKPSLLDEMRAASLLQKVSRRDGSALGASTALALGTSQGAAALDVDAGELRRGTYADYVVVDAAGMDPWTPAANALVYRAENAWILETYVGARCVRIAGQSAPEQARKALARTLPNLRL